MSTRDVTIEVIITGVCIGCQALVKTRLLDVRIPTTLCQNRGYAVNTGRLNWRYIHRCGNWMSGVGENPVIGCQK